MRTPPPDLDESDLAAVLGVEWGLRHVGLTYAPVGFGGHHWLADVAGRPVWFVTASRPRPGLASALATAVALSDSGLEFVVAPVCTELGEPLVPYRGYALSLTPWLADAVDHAAGGPEVVAVASALHGATNVVRGTATADDLAIEARGSLDDALAALDRPWGNGPYAEHVRRSLSAAAPRVRERLASYDHGVERIDRDSFVVTHGELKPGNLLATPGGVALVDWDTALLAPPERDLWRWDAQDLAAYADATGRTLDAGVLALYRDRWDLTDIALYVAELRTATVRTEDTETAWEVLRNLLP